jgi:hypothetical protein
VTTSPEHKSLRWAAGAAIALLLGCGGLVSCWVLGESTPPAGTPVTTRSPEPSPSLSESSPSAEPTKATFYKTCKDAVRAGVPLPLRSNEPGYRVALDGDEDGLACE